MTETVPALDPRHTALLVMDYQVGLLDRLDEDDGLVTAMAEAIATVRAAGGQVGYVRVAFDDADLEAVPATSMMAPTIATRGRDLHIDSPASAIHPGVSPEPGDIVVRKTRVGAFSTTDLHDQLQGRGITTLVLAGISTSGVLLSTVRDAHDRDYQLLVLEDASADPQPGVHDFLMERILPRQAAVVTVADLGGRLPAG
jgi:nicotinamidase-related amidase